jgi:hypothetical protein
MDFKKEFRLWGFRLDNLCVSSIGPCFTFLLAIVVIALWRGDLPTPWWFWVCVVAYPWWGIVQQWLVQTKLTENVFRILVELAVRKGFCQTTRTKWFILTITSLISGAAFGSAHIFSNQKLWIATTIAGVPWSCFFIMQGNIIPLGILHGFAGAVFYSAVLEQRPW